MKFGIWSFELPEDEALGIPKGSYILDNVHYTPEAVDVTKAAIALKEAEVYDIFHVQSQIMARAQKEGLAFQDWPEITPLTTA